ncbi:alpha-2-macroglobulin family protein [Neolewinella persica]|uniref:alpha-2-macroglobulin family protein n=1 Tax=Neolewinella persica TaxID=70998 RepID=UPI00038016B1|nr:MG2 domain-containing protein [Neolewinella persica]
MRSTFSARYIPVFVLLSFFLYRCEPSGSDALTVETSISVPEEIQAFTSGVINRDEGVFVQFTTAPDGDAAEMISISPNTPGVATLSGTGLSFEPANGWAAGTAYVAKVNIAGKPPFTFTFSTPTRKAEVLTEGLFIPGGNSSTVEVTGQVVTNDASTVAEIGQLLSAKQGSKAVEVEVAAGPDNRHFSYKVVAPDRGANPAPVTISYDGSKSGFSDTKGELTVAIPADDDFRVESLTRDEQEGGALLARFSDALDAKQDMKGLVIFPDNTSYTTRINGNLLYIYPKGDNLGEVTIRLSDGIKNNKGFRLGRETSWKINLGRTAPDLRIVSKGTILPHQGKRLFPFEAVGIEAVQLEIVEIFSGNVAQYLQDNSLGDSPGEWSLQRVGKIIIQERVPLSSLSGAVNTGRWSRYALDLSKYISNDAAAIYQVRLGFGMEDAVTGCDATPADFGLAPVTFNKKEDFAVGFQPVTSRMGDYYGIHGSYEGFDWREQEDPCKPAYYNRDRFITKNVISSNLGLIAKRNPDRSTIVFATDLINAAPRQGVGIKAFSYQHQELFSGTTDNMGRVSMTTTEEPALIIATSGGDAAYLDLYNDNGLPLSRFDIGGVDGAGGIKGAFYAERGVWRPGDSVFLNFVLEDRQKRIPNNYPVEFTLTDAQGRVVERRNVTPAFGSGLYPLTFATNPKDVTGNWTAMVKAGGETYRKSLMIETVKPNRLSIDYELPAGGLRPGATSVTLTSKWLYGAPGANLKAKVDMNMSSRTANFPKWSGFAFSDPAREIEQRRAEEVFDGTLNEAGTVSFDIPVKGDALPGPVNAGIGTKVFEPGGNFSIDNQTIPFDPYSVYAGVNIPEDDWGSRRVSMQGATTVPLAAVDTKGEGVSGRKLSVGLYRVNWRYWWQDNYDNVARFNGSQHTEAIETYSATTTSDGSATVKVSVSDWGRYLLRVCDSEGHCSGQYFYAGYNMEETDRESASLLRPVAEREEVSIGDEVNIKLPTSAGGKMLVSLETAVGSVEQFWVNAEAGETTVSFKTDERMVPTVYANITMLQPYEQTTNDRPVRLYGLVPVKVTNPETILQPQLTADDEWQPEGRVQVSVKENGGQDMTYTLAVVDEGLLGLTRFQTPNLHDRFFAKEALSVRTFDLYKYVIGSLNGDFGKVLAIGGDAGEGEDEDTQTANRFEPVVRHLGPFRLQGGKTGRHELTLPNYVGAVRVMVVASSNGAYGSAKKRIPVVQPLMLLPTLPRVLGPGETVDMPVNVFAMTDKVRNVSLEVKETEGLVTVPAGGQSITFNNKGSKLAYFPLTVGNKAGIARFAVTGKGNGESTSQEIEIDVRHPNEIVSRNKMIAIAPGDAQQVGYDNFGVAGSREAILELSALPAMQLDRHLRYLLRYPYGCVEQTVSPAFAQLYLDKVTELTPDQEKQRRTNVMAGLNKLRNFQTTGGGMAYWPGNRDPHPWATNYAMHFLLEAEKAGFSVPLDLKNKLVKFQGKVVNNWQESSDPFYSTADQRRRDQAYRLYGLALAGKPEIGAMNRLKSKVANLPTSAVFQLAAAYTTVGQKTTGSELVKGQSTSVKAYRELGYTFGSDIRDMAMILEAQLASGDQSAAGQQAFRLAERIGARSWLSTQEAAFAFVAIGKMSEADNRELKADFTSPTGAKSAIGANTGIYRIELPAEGASSSFTVKNTGTSTLYASVVTSGKPLPGEEAAVNENLVLDVKYTDESGKAVDVSSLASGTDFIANYTVRNPGTLGMSYRQLALKSLLPSGWEVSNDRIDATGGMDSGTYAYRDFRDDRVYTFFDLNRGESKTFSLRMTATYPGRYYLPSQVSEAMYANDVKAAVKGRWVEVLRSSK